MRIPFLSPKRPALYKGMSSAADVTVIPSHEIAMPRLRPRTLEEALASRDRSRRIRANGAQPS
jgi:hypothetical protein